MRGHIPFVVHKWIISASPQILACGKSEKYCTTQFRQWIRFDWNDFGLQAKARGEQIMISKHACATWNPMDGNY